jgi:hypothetical protein
MDWIGLDWILTGGSPVHLKLAALANLASWVHFGGFFEVIIANLCELYPFQKRDHRF